MSEGFSGSFTSTNIEATYVSGNSLTHGPPGTRQHVWTFIGAENDVDVVTFLVISLDPIACNPSLVMTTSVTLAGIHLDMICFYNDPLWDGKGCGSTSSYCEFNSPPWFCKSLPQPTPHNLEIRLCGYHLFQYENKIITSMDIYIT